MQVAEASPINSEPADQGGNNLFFFSTLAEEKHLYGIPYVLNLLQVLSRKSLRSQ